MKNFITKGLSIMILAIAFMTFTTKGSTLSYQTANTFLNDDYGRFQLVVKKVAPGLETKKDFKAYVKISRQKTQEVVMNSVITVQYMNGQLISDMLELPLGNYKLEQMVLLPDTNSDESNASIKIQLPILFTVAEKQ